MGSLIYCGVTDKSISPFLKAWIKQGDQTVCGIIGPGTSRTLASKWDSPLEQANLGSTGPLQMFANGMQAVSGRTTITTFSSTQVWQGNMPLKFSLNLIFMAQSNAYNEVMMPLEWLEEFASPDLGFATPGGRIPRSVIINVGRRIIVPECVIENITIPLDKEKNKNGDLIRAEVQLDIQTKVMLNRADIRETWKGTNDSLAAAKGSDWQK